MSVTIRPAIGAPITERQWVRRGELLEVRRVSDRDPDKLRALDLLGFHLDEEVEVVKESLYEGPVVVKVGGHRRQVPLGLARAVYVA